MFINQTRVIATSFFNEFENKSIRLAIPIDSTTSDNAQRIGFTKNLVEGEKVLPKIIGPVSRRNSEGYNIVHRDQEKETCYRTIEWTWKQWVGGGDTEEVTDFRDVPYRRYPRTFMLPFSMELIIMKKDNKKYIISERMDYKKTLEDYLKNGINLYLEIFGQCHIVDNEFDKIELSVKIVRLNWDILPPGEYPWEKRYKQIKPFIDKASERNKPVIEHRLRKMNSYKPDFVAIGINGFSGYMVFGYKNKSIYIFESTHVNNATYVFDQNWKDVSQLTKKDILSEKRQKERILHRAESWDENVDKLFRK